MSGSEKVTYRISGKVHYGRYFSAALIFLGLALIVRAFWVGHIRWELVGDYLFGPSIINGIINTLILTAAAMVVGIVLGLAAALMTLSQNPVLNLSARAYIMVFRSVPVLLQLLIWYNLGLVFPTIGIPGLFSVPTTDVVTPFIASLLAFGIMQGSYTSEVIRAGLLSVSRGQSEAATAIGMTRMQSLRRIIIPQAMVVIIPPIGNEVIGMVKYTSIASIIQYKDVIYSAQTIYYTNGRVIELLMVCAFWYLLVVIVLSILQRYVENYFGRHHKR
ncbi:amino acid ABC transporter permease [Hoeflea alexandrii]|uniref:amino acid ABC transporter permease n=1 Tax=Hoeflea alexandrii TaxID=288436 RepID=UPI0022B0240F|nr:amino acid ABC transporter permease [Hoeflea alexandrii]MCZ4291514.1 amino acid ABC transporter permease [Hoeflea alexandrii]